MMRAFLSTVYSDRQMPYLKHSMTYPYVEDLFHVHWSEICRRLPLRQSTLDMYIHNESDQCALVVH